MIGQVNIYKNFILISNFYTRVFSIIKIFLLLLPFKVKFDINENKLNKTYILIVN